MANTSAGVINSVKYFYRTGSDFTVINEQSDSPETLALIAKLMLL